MDILPLASLGSEDLQKPQQPHLWLRQVTDLPSRRTTLAKVPCFPSHTHTQRPPLSIGAAGGAELHRALGSPGVAHCACPSPMVLPRQGVSAQLSSGRSTNWVKGLTAMVLKSPASGLPSSVYEQPTPSKCPLAFLTTWGNVLFANVLLAWCTGQDANSPTPCQYFQRRPSHSLCLRLRVLTQERSTGGPSAEMQSPRPLLKMELWSPPCPRSFSLSQVSA